MCCPSQCTPDPEFPTVAFPNPEEKGALDRACAYADEQVLLHAVANALPSAVSRLGFLVVGRGGRGGGGGGTA